MYSVALASIADVSFPFFFPGGEMEQAPYILHTLSFPFPSRSFANERQLAGYTSLLSISWQ